MEFCRIRSECRISDHPYQTRLSTFYLIFPTQTFLQSYMTLSQQQSQALERIRNFVTDKSQTVFILKGYAGTGKTTLIKNLIPDLSHLGKEVVLLAPTGRSAKVLSQKTTYPASTIHRAIYALDKMQVVRHNEHGELIQTSLLEKDSDLRSKGSDDLQFWFSIRQHDTNHNPTSS